MAQPVHIEIETRNRITVRFPYSTNDVERMRKVSGRSFSRTDKCWTVPLNMAVCRQLRKLFGDRLVLGQGLRSWAIEAARQEQHLKSMASASAGDLSVLRAKLPTLWRALYLGPLGKHAVTELGYSEADIDAAMALCSYLSTTAPWAPEHGSYQTADVRFLADARAPLNANHQGLGKTPEAIAEVFESGREIGNHLVLCPSAAIDGTWAVELDKWLDDVQVTTDIFPVFGTRAEREAMLEEFLASDAQCKWLIINPAMVQYDKCFFRIPMIGGYWLTFPDPRGSMAIKAKEKERRQACKCSRMKAPHWHYAPSYPQIMNVSWRTIINDEVHKGNIRNHRSITSKSINELRRAPDCKPVAMSGTPMKKRGGDIWGILHWLRPDVFTSSWNFWGMFFEIDENRYGKKVLGLREEMEEEFYRYLDPYVLRRTKAEALPWLPDKQHVDVFVTLTDRQQAQYDRMEAEGIAQDDGIEQVATSTLAEMTRLRQFANCYHKVKAGGHYIPDPSDSAKLEALFEKLEETGIMDGERPDKTIIFSGFNEMIVACMAKLDKAGVEYGVISGHTRDRRRLIDRFQNGDLRVMLVVTSSGGVSLTLDAADTAHFIDEDWAPDVQEQAEDRLHRASRIHQVLIYHFIARNTIDEYVRETAFDKKEQHERILDIRRRIEQRHAA